MNSTSPGEPAMPPADLRAYGERIGWHGPFAPNLETLAGLIERHVAAIPFEAIDVVLGRGVDLAPESIDGKLIAGRRGGYCFEQNGLFKRVLETIGFEVEGLAARVNWQAPPGAPVRPATHMALRVTIEGTPWLADVGFGGLVPPAPLRLDTAEPQPTRHETFRFVPLGGELQLEAELAGEWHPVYRLTAEPRLDADYELLNWYTATHPESRFRNQLIVARATPEARHALAGARLTVRWPDGTSERRVLTADELERELAEGFGLPVEPEWRPLIERVVRETGEAEEES